jgi:1-acyl-sn-glycerol-3-phosphate acyltransferase
MSLVPARPDAGLQLNSMTDRPDRVPQKKGEYSIASRALALSTYFLSGALAVNISQFLGTPLYLVNQDWYNAWIAFTKQSFGLLTMTLTQAFAPTKVIVSGDASVRGQMRVSADGNLVLDFPNRLVLIANHQIYTDWLYLWWIAYCNGMHGRLYIILKESLKKIPVLGWGMQMSQFIFLKRNWEKDKPHMADALAKLNKPSEPMWLMLFPEGTNLAPSTREKSAAWAKKQGMKDMFHTLIPRSTGLQFCLQELHGTTDYLYDCTVAYEGVPRGQYAQDIFTLKAGYLEGRPPKSVHMYWRRFAIKDIPFQNEKTFDLWLIARWREKDLLMENYLRTGRFPADKGTTKYTTGRVVKGTGHSEVQIRSSHWYEFLQIFAPMGALAMILAVFYGALPESFWKSFNKQALKSNTQEVKKAGRQAGTQVKSAATTASGLTLDDFFDEDKQEDSFKKGALAVQSWLGTPQAQSMMNKVDFVSQFVQDPESAVKDTLKGQRKDFMHSIKEEELKRQKSNLPNSAQNVGVQKGTFWKDLDRLDNSRHGSMVSSVPPSGKPTGTFYDKLQAAEQKKARGLGYDARGTFWDKMKTEENTRSGTVRTISSGTSTPRGTVRTLPSTPAWTSRAPSIAPSGTATPRRPSLLNGTATPRRPSQLNGTSNPPTKTPARPPLTKTASTANSVASTAPKKLPIQSKTGSSTPGTATPKLKPFPAVTAVKKPASTAGTSTKPAAAKPNNPRPMFPLNDTAPSKPSTTTSDGAKSMSPTNKQPPPKPAAVKPAVKAQPKTPSVANTGQKLAPKPKAVNGAASKTPVKTSPSTKPTPAKKTATPATTKSPAPVKKAPAKLGPNAVAKKPSTMSK